MGITFPVMVPEHWWKLSPQSVPVLAPASPKLWGLPGSCHAPPYPHEGFVQNSLVMSLCPLSSLAFLSTANHKGFPSPELWAGPQTTNQLLHCWGEASPWQQACPLNHDLRTRPLMPRVTGPLQPMDERWL